MVSLKGKWPESGPPEHQAPCELVGGYIGPTFGQQKNMVARQAAKLGPPCCSVSTQLDIKSRHSSWHRLLKMRPTRNGSCGAASAAVTSWFGLRVPVDNSVHASSLLCGRIAWQNEKSIHQPARGFFSLMNRWMTSATMRFQTGIQRLTCSVQDSKVLKGSPKSCHPPKIDGNKAVKRISTPEGSRARGNCAKPQFSQQVQHGASCYTHLAEVVEWENPMMFLVSIYSVTKPPCNLKDSVVQAPQEDVSGSFGWDA